MLITESQILNIVKLSKPEHRRYDRGRAMIVLGGYTMSVFTKSGEVWLNDKKLGTFSGTHIQEILTYFKDETEKYTAEVNELFKSFVKVFLDTV